MNNVLTIPGWITKMWAESHREYRRPNLQVLRKMRERKNVYYDFEYFEHSTGRSE